MAELRHAVSPFSMKAGLAFVTYHSARVLRNEPLKPLALANTFNLPLLAKAFVLWGQLETGAAVTEDQGDSLLRAINSLPWYSRLAAEFDTDDTVLGMIIRQGFQRYYTDDPADAHIARVWMMFHDLVKEGGLAVPDPSGELEKLLGVSAEDLWVVGMMIWTLHISVTALDRRAWVLRPSSFVQEGPRQQELNELIQRVLQTTALTPAAFRARYAETNSKYRSETNREGHWVSEFNILRDFPVVDLENGTCVAPFPIFALTRAIDGFYYDLLDEFARRKRASGAKDNPYDNEMNNTLGTLFERYVGHQLKLLTAPNDQLRGEFLYGKKREQKLSTDWILCRPGRRPVLFECKAREAVLDVQRYADLEELRTEVGKALGKACRQLVKFIQAVDAKAPGLEQYFGQTEFICAVVLQAPLPFHMVKDIREIIEQVAANMEPGWSAIRGRIAFVPMSVRELETAVATEVVVGVPIEDQLQRYAAYREKAKRIDRWDENHMPVFPRHLEEFLQEQYGQSQRISNPLCTAAWNEFAAFCQRRIFDEEIDVADAELFALTQQRAYHLWEQRGRPLWDDQRDWYKAEEQIVNDAELVKLPRP
ncbi:MAG: DUF2934 domain-containing protein [Planctomycetaceae bacterium]|nr:DUF2934 domain-containing protein [Planctomycetaceae bacterium]